MSRIFLFCHGFGLSNSYWKEIVPYFKEEECIFLSYQNNFSYCPNIKDKNIEYIAIGHSLGFIKIQMLEINIKYFIGLNAFTNFLGFNNEIYKKRYREYTIFKKNILKFTDKTLKKFYEQCGINNFYQPIDINTNNLENDLFLLKQNHFMKNNTKTLIINSINDQVVSHDLTKDNFINQSISLIMMPDGKHSLGISDADKIANIIFDFIS
ncbi:MAG: hypothetical protein OEY79_03320 [Anaplasmataceae bacterium]|nr:hypothetical protein [Anaplasmataceae bacterium]